MRCTRRLPGLQSSTGGAGRNLPGLARSLLPLGVLGVLGVLGDAVAGGGAVDFLPTPSGNVGAFLVAGPFEKPQGGIERLGPAREAEELPGGRRWKLVTTHDGNGIAVGGPGVGSGIYYVRTEFPADPPGGRAASVVATCRVTIWAASPGQAEIETATASAYMRKKLEFDKPEFDALPGPLVLLARLEPRRSRAGLAIRAGLKLPNGRVLPEGGRLELADVSKERMAELVRRSLRLRLTPKLVPEGSPVLVELTRIGSPPDVAGEIDVEIAPVEKEFLRGFRGRTRHRVKLRDLGRDQAGVAADFMIHRGAPGLFHIEARLTRAGERLATLTQTGYVSQGLPGLADSLEERGRALGGTFPSVGAFARLQADKVRLSLGRGAGPAAPALLGEDIELAERGLKEAQEGNGRDFQKDQTGFHERAYVSEIDDSAQPYLVYVPTAYRPGEAMPLVVYLHGYVPSYDKDDWLKGDPQVNAVMEAEGCILAIPFGRSNTDFLNVGEDDVLAVIDRMKRHYSVDPRRIYIYGYSMGGSGVWTMITHFPDRFAAAVILAGRTDYFLWHGVKREELPPWRRFVIEDYNPIDYVENIVHMPIRIYHGAADYVVKRGQSKIMAEKLRAAGGRCELYWVPRGSHWSLFDTVLWKRAPVAWMKKHALPERPPREFKITAMRPRYASAWGFGVLIYRRAMELALLQVAGNPDPLEIKVRNTFSFLAPTVGYKSLEVLDGGEYGGTMFEDGRVVYRWGLSEPMKLPKWTGLSGPIKDAFRSPFCIVYGTTGSEKEKREVKANAERFRKEWRGFAKGWAPIFADTEVTNELMTKKNLILFGEPATNRLLADFADSLPIRWDRNQATIAGRTFSMKRRGLAFVYPNPKHPRRGIVVFSGIPWGAHLPSNHKWDLMPDFILYTPDADMIDRMEKTNDWIVAGFFGTDWSLERGRIFVKGVGEVNARGQPLAPAPEAEAAPEPELVPEAPPGFQPVR